ncbi:MAG: TonB family protein [Bryobacteraceae bacterium]
MHAATRPATVSRFDWISMLSLLLAAGSGIGLLRLAAGLRAARRLVRTSRVVDDPRVATEIAPWAEARESTRIAVPVAVGLRTPTILLPTEWRSWSAGHLRSVLAHEAAHVRRHDWAIMLLATTTRRILWFHPLVWWLERRLASLAEEACDDECVAGSGDRTIYAEALLDTARALAANPNRILPAGAAMARTSRLSERIQRVLDGRTGLPLRPYSRVALLLLALPMVYAASALQVQRPAPVIVDPSASQAVTYWLTPQEVGELETRVERNPEDVEARKQLLEFYILRGPIDEYRRHALWLIRNRPGSDLAVRTSFTMSHRDPDGEARRLWLRQIDERGNEPQVLANAAIFFGSKDPARAEQLWLELRRRDPENRRWTFGLARLYSQNVAQVAIPSGGDPAFARHALTTLETAADADLVGRVASQLVPAGSRIDPLRPVTERLLRRAIQLDSSNPEWRWALQRLHEPPRPFPPPAPEGMRGSAVIDGPALLNRVEPKYPTEAREKGVRGHVLLLVSIDTDGRVMRVTPRFGDPLLVDAAVEAVREWRYEAGAAEVIVEVDVPFLPAER